MARKYRIRFSASATLMPSTRSGAPGRAQVAPAAGGQDDDAERRGGEDHAQAEQHRRRHVGVGDHDADGAVGEAGEADLEVAAQALGRLARPGGALRARGSGHPGPPVPLVVPCGAPVVPCVVRLWCRVGAPWCRGWCLWRCRDPRAHTRSARAPAGPGARRGGFRPRPAATSAAHDSGSSSGSASPLPKTMTRTPAATIRAPPANVVHGGRSPMSRNAHSGDVTGSM